MGNTYTIKPYRRLRKMKKFIADFETVTDENTKTQTHTEVWAWAIAELFDNTENVKIGNDIKDFFEYCRLQGKHIVVYYVNLKFDGQFILSNLLNEQKYRTGFDYVNNEMKNKKDLKTKELSYCISDVGQWYSITVRYKNCLIEFRDTLKLLPFSVKALEKAFDTKHHKLEMDYKGHRAKGEYITEEEQKYIINDILVPKESLEKFLTAMKWKKNTPLTIASGALREFKQDYTQEQYETYFPNLAEIELNPYEYGSDNADSYIRKAYYGGWCYAHTPITNCIQGKTKKTPNNRIHVFDVNSLYPSVMHSKSGSIYPVGSPTFFKGKPPRLNNRYYFIRFRCNFELKRGYLPFIQVKNNVNYRRNDNLRSSFYNRNGDYDNTIRPIMTMSQTLFTVFAKCYKLTDFEYLDGCYFNTEKGVFDNYINKYFRMKQENNDNKVLRTCAKLMLNSLYGRFGLNPMNRFKVAHVDSEQVVDLDNIQGQDKEPVYIPIACAITSYARVFTLNGAHKYKDYFCYSDTDSIHLNAPKDTQFTGIPVHDTNLCSWKLENVFDCGVYIRQKTYCEYTGNVYDVKACGMSQRAKDLLVHSFNGTKPTGKLTESEEKFLSKKRTIKDFKQGLTIPSNLQPKTIKGGCVLVETDFTIK